MFSHYCDYKLNDSKHKLEISLKCDELFYNIHYVITKYKLFNESIN